MDKFALVLGVVVLAAVVGLVWYQDQAIGYLALLNSEAAETQQGPELTVQEPMDIQGLKIEDIIVGTGAEARPGNRVTVHYVGTLMNGTKFDSSRDRGEPFAFTLGKGEVIKGWDLGVAGMKMGGKRKLTIASELAYGERGAGGIIGSNETLVFEVELLDVK
ncbi:MAG: FKBP-type peptidyl-prolyl cis-trans isomerase [bacterium]|nr:FKBP-type peptidyl-prolyl cis-trans isomerase [bacterium]